MYLKETMEGHEIKSDLAQDVDKWTWKLFIFTMYKITVISKTSCLYTTVWYWTSFYLLNVFSMCFSLCSAVNREILWWWQSIGQKILEIKQIQKGSIQSSSVHRWCSIIMVMNLWISQKVGNFLADWGLITFSSGNYSMELSRAWSSPLTSVYCKC